MKLYFSKNFRVGGFDANIYLELKNFIKKTCDFTHEVVVFFASI